jgi:hypothetical protein
MVDEFMTLVSPRVDLDERPSGGRPAAQVSNKKSTVEGCRYQGGRPLQTYEVDFESRLSVWLIYKEVSLIALEATGLQRK